MSGLKANKSVNFLMNPAGTIVGYVGDDGVERAAAFGGLVAVQITQAAYTALGGSVDPNTLYVIVG